MANKRKISYEQKMIAALNKLPIPLEDKKHNIKIYLENDRARSNQSRFEHIIDSRHGLRPSDIDRVQRYIKKCIFKKDSERTETYNIYIKRSNISDEYIKISIRINPESPDIGIVKTIFITKVIK